MPKMKSNSGAKKRFSLTGTGKVKRSQAGRRHILTSKSKTRKRNLRGNALVDDSQEHQIKAMLPYGRQ
jgi:large subunit ribosomal protein L35